MNNKIIIKAKLGSPSTLLNAGETTNFVYEICDISLTDEDLTRINGIESRQKLKDRISEIYHMGGSLKFVKTQRPIFQNNLTLIDSMLPCLLAELLILSQETGVSQLKDLVTRLESKNPLGFDSTNDHKYYEYKIKRFLVDVALGLMPGKVWDGIYEATGGYLVVKEDGDILCYHIYNRNDFEDYLLNNTKLDTASTSKHKFGVIYEENGKYFIKLNLQIRFK